MMVRMLRPGATWGDVEAWEQDEAREGRYRHIYGPWFPKVGGGEFCQAKDAEETVWKVTGYDGPDNGTIYVAEECDGEWNVPVPGGRSWEFPTFTEVVETLDLYVMDGLR